ncbi:MAG: U32 family peptidase, partial [Clostridia bacterium]
VNPPKITSVDSLKERTNRATKLAVSAETIEEAKAALEAGADYIYFGSEKEISYFSDDILEAKKLLGEKFVWRLPRITEDNSLEAYLSMYKKIKPETVYADNLGQIYKLKDKSSKTISGSGLFVMNSLSALELQRIGVDEITLSVELNEGQIRDLLKNYNGSVNMVVGEKTLLMIHQSCILAGVNKCAGDSCKMADYYLKDRLDYIFDLGFDDKCRSYLYNSQDLALIDHLSDIVSMNVDTITLDISGRGEVIVKELTNIYSKALVETKRLGKINVSEYKVRIQAVVGNQLTRGHWHRGV